MNKTGCPYCGMTHGATCPLVKAFDYYPDGAIKRVEFWPSAIRELAGPLIKTEKK